MIGSWTLKTVTVSNAILSVNLAERSPTYAQHAILPLFHYQTFKALTDVSQTLTVLLDVLPVHNQSQ